MIYNDISEVQLPQQFKYGSQQDIVVRSYYQFTADNRIYFDAHHYRDLIDHEYRLTIDIQSPVNAYGLAIDFFDIDEIYYQYIHPKLDGQLINNTLILMNTTAENIANWLWEQFKHHLPSGHHICRLELAETAQHSVILDSRLNYKRV